MRPDRGPTPLSTTDPTTAGLRRPRRLRAGDRVAAVTPSWGGPAVHPLRYEAGRRQLEAALGVEVVEMPHTLAPPDVLERDPAARADDLHRAFADPDITAVVSTIGGDDSMRLLPFLDLDLLAEHPTIFVGYSDATVTHVALRRAGLVSFYGPAVMAGFGENAGLHRYLLDGVRRALFDTEPSGEWPPNTAGWTVEFTDWDEPEAQQEPRTLTPSEGWRWHGGEPARGISFAACVEVLDPLRGTRWWPDLTRAVLFLQTSEEALPPLQVTRFLRALALTGELHDVAAVVLGRPGGSDLTHAERRAYDDAVLRVIRDEERLDDLPLVCNVDFGHTDPMWTIPQGVTTTVDPELRSIRFEEPGVG